MAGSVFEKPYLSRQADHLRDAWNNIADLNMVGGLKNIVAIGGDTLTLGALGVRSMLASEVGQDTLKTEEKILPKVLFVATLPITATAAAITVVGATALAPPFVFAASIAGVVRSVTALIEDKKSSDNLNKVLISKEGLQKQIDKSKLTDEDKAVIKDNLELPKVLYDKLYMFREDILKNENLTAAQKNQFIEQIHQKIEQFYNGDLSDIKIDLEGVPERTRMSMEKLCVSINKDLKNYQNAQQKFEAIDMPDSLKKSINRHKKTHEHIYAQDIPEPTKRKMLSLLNKPKIRAAEHASINAQLANHYVNQQSLSQIHALDKTFSSFILDKYQNVNEGALSRFLTVPRDIYQQVHELSESLPLEKRKQFKEEVLYKIEKSPIDLLGDSESPTANIEKLVTGFANKYGLPEDAKENCLANVNKLKKEQKRLLGYFECMQPPMDGQDIRAMQSHRDSALSSLINTRGIVVSPPKVYDEAFLSRAAQSKIVPKYLRDRAKEVSQKVTAPLAEAFSSAKKGMYERIYSEEKASEILAKKQDKSANRDDFKRQFAGSHQFLKQVQERNYLKRAVPRRVLGIGLALGNMVVTGISSLALPAIFSPAAPVAVGASVGLGVISAGLTVGSVANSASLIIEHGKSHKKAAQPKHVAKRGIEPDFGRERVAVDDLKQRKEHALLFAASRKPEKKTEKAAKPEAPRRKHGLR